MITTLVHYRRNKSKLTTSKCLGVIYDCVLPIVTNVDIYIIAKHESKISCITDRMSTLAF